MLLDPYSCFASVGGRISPGRLKSIENMKGLKVRVFQRNGNRRTFAYLRHVVLGEKKKLLSLLYEPGATIWLP